MNISVILPFPKLIRTFVPYSSKVIPEHRILLTLCYYTLLTQDILEFPISNADRQTVGYSFCSQLLLHNDYSTSLHD